MNTATLTRDTLTTQEQAARDLRNALVCAWRANPKQGASAHAAYAMIRGKSMEKTFSPITRPTKLANGFTPHQGRDQAIWAAKIGSNEAWEWAREALVAAGVSTDARGRLDLSSHPLLAQWRDKAAAEVPSWI